MSLNVDAMKCAECGTPALLLRMIGLCPIGDPARCPLVVPSPRRWTRASVGNDAYCELTDTIDPGAEL